MPLSAIEVTGIAQYDAWQARKYPAVEHLTQRILSVPVVFPRHPMRYTLCYIFHDAHSCVLLDPGFASNSGFDQIDTALRVIGLGISDVTGIIATHFHIDHLGLARRVAAASGAWVAMGQHERHHLSAFESAADEIHQDQLRLRTWGVPAGRVSEAAMSEPMLVGLAGLATPDTRIRDGETFQIAGHALTAVATPGHTPGHICFWDHTESMVYSGDHVLPRITPNVSLSIQGETNPLERYLASLRRIARNDHYEVCPAHEYRFRGIAGRARELEAKSLARVGEVVDALDAGANSVYDIARQLTWSRGWSSLTGTALRLALGETAAHVQYLVGKGLHEGVPGLPILEDGDPDRGVDSHAPTPHRLMP